MGDVSRMLGGLDRGMGGGLDRDRRMSSLERVMSGRDMDLMRGGGGMDSMDRMGGGSMRGMGAKISDKIVVKNLPMDITWQTLKDRFGHAGDIKFAEMRERGVGVIRFGNERDAERAVSMMNGQRLEGR